MSDYSVVIPDSIFVYDLTIIYKGKEVDGKNETITEIKTSKDEFLRKLRYFKNRSQEINNTNEVYIHDKYPQEIFKEFIATIETKKVSLNENNFNSFHQLSLKYEYYELQKQIEYFIQNRPDLQLLINQLTEENSESSSDTESENQIDPYKEELIAQHLDICLQNENMENLPISSLHRIFSSPKKVLKDHHLLYEFVSKMINKYESNPESGQTKEDLKILVGSLDYQKMTSEEIESILNKNYLSNVFVPQTTDDRKTQQKLQAIESKMVFLESFYVEKIKNLEESQKEILSRLKKQEETINKYEFQLQNLQQREESHYNEYLDEVVQTRHQSKPSKPAQPTYDESKLAQIQRNKEELKRSLLAEQKSDKPPAEEKVVSKKSEKPPAEEKVVSKKSDKQPKPITTGFDPFTSKQSVEPSTEKLVMTKEIGKQPFSGIIAEMTKENHGNLNDKGIIEITGNRDDDYGTFSSLVDFSYSGNCYISEADTNSFLCFDFKSHKIALSGYAIKSSNIRNPNYLVSWVIEGSNDRNDWTNIDSHLNDRSLCSKSKSIIFPIQEKSKIDQRFRFIQLRLTGKSPRNNCIFNITNIEFFGKLYSSS